MPIDTYGRITSAGTQWRSIDAVDLDPVMFVDTQFSDGQAASDVATRIRSAPPTATAAARHVVLRVPPDSNDEWRLELCHQVSEVLDRLGLRALPSVIALPVGQLPWQCGMVSGVPTTCAPDLLLLGRSRRIELTSMLLHNNGVWNPTDYHFRLPSGAHGNCFIRVADAIRTPLDALGIASWLASSVTESTGLLLDSASLVGVATALDAIVARSGRRLGPVVSLEEYPKNRLDTMKAVRDVDRGENVLAVLSVHSTGSLNDRLSAALSQVASSDWSIQILVDKSGEPGGEDLKLPGPPADEFSRVDVWTKLGKERDVPAQDCGSCRRGPARVAQIDPRTFDGMVLPSPEMLMPSTPWAFGQRRFWELVDASDAVSIDAPSDVSGLHPRYATDKFMSVKIDFSQLLADDQWVASAGAAHVRLDNLLSSPKQTDIAPPYDLILVDEREADLPNFRSFLDRLTGLLGESPPVLVWPNPDNPDSAADSTTVLGAKHILLFRLGLVSGLSLQQTMYRVQQHRRGTAAYEMDALIVHLRPQDGRVRETLRNSLAHRMASLWDSYLPEERDPFQEEIDLLTSMHSDLDPDAAAFQDRRLAMGSGFPADGQILWGAGQHDGPDATRLSPMSWFGEGLRVRAAYVAIGAAVQHARMNADAPRSAPVWRMFEMPAILRSYYDPIIVCCILRWLRPTEIWWGEDMRQAEAILVHLCRRTGPEEQVMLLSELLLAAAQSKVPGPLCDWLRPQATLLADSVGAPANSPLRLGLAITSAV